MGYLIIINDTILAINAIYHIYLLTKVNDFKIMNNTSLGIDTIEHKFLLIKANETALLNAIGILYCTYILWCHIIVIYKGILWFIGNVG